MSALPIATADIETNPFAYGRKLTAFLAGWYDGTKIRKFWGENCLRECYKSMRRFPGYIYLHNGGKFDLRHFLTVIPPGDIIPDGNPPIHGRIASLRIVDGPTFLDSYLILPVPLSAHGKEQINYAIFEPDKREIPANRRKINSYFDTDLTSLYDFVTEFVNEYGHGLTLAGRAFAKAKELLDIKQFPQTTQWYDKRYREFYYGGRCQFYSLGKVPFATKCYDLNSAYPHAMLSRHCWGAKFELRSTMPPRSFEQSFFHIRGKAEGCFPVRGKTSLEYPTKTGDWHVTGWELKAAMETGAFKLDKICAVHMPKITRDFAAYVHHFYNLKKNAKTPSERLFAKLFLNSFYGRFALNPRHHKETLWLPYGEVPSKKLYGEGWEIEKIWADCDLTLWSKPKPENQWRFFDVALAASITGCVRASLWRSLCAVDRPVYCDTDSIICADGTGLKVGAELGDWKLEAESEPGNLWIAGKKLYAMQCTDGHWKTASKGVQLSPQDIIKVSMGETVEWKSEAPSYSLYRDDSFTVRKVKRATESHSFSSHD